MRAIMVAILLWVAGTARADEVHKRGDFQFETGPAPVFVVSEPLAERWDPRAPGAKDAQWRFWRHELQADRRRGRDQVYVDYAYETLSESFVSEAGRFQISFNPEYQRLVIHRADLRRAGVWNPRLAADKVSLARRESGFEKDMSDGLVTALIVLEDVRVGDVVRISYSVVGRNPVMAGQTSDWMRFASTNPMLEASLRVLMDPDSTPRIYRSKGAPQAAVRKSSEAVEVTMGRRNIAAIVNEDDYPDWFQPYPLVQVAPEQAWSDVVAWGLPLYPAVQSLPAELEAKLVEWRKLPDDKQRMTAALRTVQDEIRYFGVEMGENTHRPAAPVETWQRRYGDCKDKAYLLSTLLQRMGIEAVPALVSVERGRAIAEFVPSASDFDHVIVRARIDGKPVWMDPTISQQGGDPTSVDLSRYGTVLPLVAGSAALQTVEAPVSVAKSTVVTERYEVPKDGGNVKLSIQTVYEGQAADYARRTMGSQRPDELSRRYSDYYRKRFGELSVSSDATLSDDRQANRVQLTESYLLKAPFQESGTSRWIDLYAESMQAVSALPSSMARTGPLDFAQPGKYSHRIELTYPSSWKPGFTAEQSSHASPAFEYRRKVTVAPDKIDVTFDLDVKGREVAAADTSTHISQLREVREGISQRLSFLLVAPTSSKEREQRIRALLRDMKEQEK